MKIADLVIISFWLACIVGALLKISDRLQTIINILGMITL